MPALALGPMILKAVKNPWVIGSIVAVAVIAGAYLKGRFDEKKLAEAAILDTVIDGAFQVIEAQNESRERAERIAKLLQERQEISKALEQALLEEIPTYVTPQMDELCRAPADYGRMLNQARKSRPVLPGDARASDGRASEAP